jgi:uncharacterized protein
LQHNAAGISCFVSGWLCDPNRAFIALDFAGLSLSLPTVKKFTALPGMLYVGQSPEGIFMKTFGSVVIGLFASIALVMAWPCCAASTETYPALSSHVTDRAGVLGGSAGRLGEKLEAFETATGKQVFVLTIPSTEGRPIDQYAVEVFQQWKVGRAGVDDGVLFVIAVADRRMRIEVGYGLEGTLTDARCARIIRDTVAPQFAQGRYETGIEAGVASILDALAPGPIADYAGAASLAPPRQEIIGSARNIKPILAFVGVLLFGIAIFTTGYGFVGLVLFVMAGMALPMLVFPGTQGALLLILAVVVWSCIRWRLIAHNVRTHQLPGSGNHLLTWIWYFFAPGLGTPDIPGRNAFTVNVSFNSGPDDKGSSGDAGCSGHGGRSGGGGASGSW